MITFVTYLLATYLLSQQPVLECTDDGEHVLCTDEDGRILESRRSE